MYTCITCRVVFQDAALHREHYKCDWHRYNLKRKVAELPPVTLEQFEQKVQQQNLASGGDGEETKAGSNIVCTVCNKHFSTDNAYTNHINSKKHRDTLEHDTDKRKSTSSTGRSSQSESDKHIETTDKLSADDDDDEWEDIEDEVEEGDMVIPPTHCLFCDLSSTSVEDNVKHMSVGHSFFIPDIEYVTDLAALLTYLGYKVGVGCVCLWCGDRGKRFHQVFHVRRHMLDKGHSKMRFDGEAAYEYSDYYDYSSTYPDHDTAADGEMEFSPELSPDQILLLSDTEGAASTYELKLPSGSSIGHRSLLRYYRQNLVPYHNKSAAAAGEQRSKRAVKDVLAHYKAIGWINDTQSLCEQKKIITDMKYLHTWKQKHYQQLGLKANKLQKHYRSQISWK